MFYTYSRHGTLWKVIRAMLVTDKAVLPELCNRRMTDGSHLPHKAI